jgi:Uma2 family endonuclease
MAPAPAYEHQRIVSAIDRFLGPLCERHGRGVLAIGINVFNEASRAEDYRIPDFTFIAGGRERLLARDGVRGGGPDAVIEVRSPDDETYDRLPFFAGLGVREVIVIDRDTKKTEIFRLAGSQYVAVMADRDRWLLSDVLNVRFRQTESGRLAIEDAEDPGARTEI